MSKVALSPWDRLALRRRVARAVRKRVGKADAKTLAQLAVEWNVSVSWVRKVATGVIKTPVFTIAERLAPRLGVDLVGGRASA
jgi:hypothetical protein